MDVTISIDRESLESVLTKAKSRPDMHSLHCPYFTWYGGECNCWVSKARKALDAQTEGSK